MRVNVAGRTLPGARAAAAYVALYENGLSSDVKSGENKGVVLRHDFVVRRWVGPFAFDAGALDLTQTLALAADAVPGQSGVAVIAVDDRGRTLQALALPLHDCGG